MTIEKDQLSESIFSERDTTRHFLFHPRATSAPDKDRISTKPDTNESVQKAFPDILWGHAFQEMAMEHMQDVSCFGVMVISLDDDSQTGLLRAGQIIEKLCQAEFGIWGGLGTEALGCFFPGKNDQETLHLAKEIQGSFQADTNGSVSIGVADYPTNDYTKMEILINAKKALTHASFFGPNSAVRFDAVSLNISGDDLYQQGDVTGAIEELHQALQIDPGNVNVINSLGVCLGVAGKLEEALEAFDKALQIDPQEVMALYNSGYVYSLLDQPEEAMRFYHLAVSTGEEIYEVAFQLGRLHQDQDDLKTAKKHFEKAITLRPESWIAHFHMGECCQVLGLNDEAILHFEKAIKKNPEDACALSALGALYNDKQENPEISAMFCEKAVEMSPENGLYRFRLGTVYFQQNQPQKAYSAFSKAVELGYPAEAEMNMVTEHLAGESDDR